jgi:hypothetical protein
MQPAITIIPTESGRLRFGRWECNFRRLHRRSGECAGPRGTIKRKPAPNMNVCRVLFAPPVKGAAVDRRTAACPARFRCVSPGRVRYRYVFLPGAAGGYARRQAGVKAPCIARESALRKRRKLLVFCRLLPDGAGVDTAREDPLVQNGCVVNSFQKYSPDKSGIFDGRANVRAVSSSVAK